MEILLSNNKKSFYWVGFLLADGHISNNRIKMNLSIKDSEHLRTFGEYLGCENLKFGDNQCSINTQNKNVCPLICEKFDISNTKTYNPMDLSKLNFDKELLLSLIIGFIDGDGCIGKVHNRNDCSLRIHLHKNWIHNLIFIENFIYDYFKYPKDKILSRVGNDGYSLLRITNNEVLSNLKKEVIKFDLPVLNRKWSLINEKFISKYTMKIVNENKVVEMYLQGMKPKSIMKNMDLKEGVVYKYIREYKKNI